jgi:hypothetical protein
MQIQTVALGGSPLRGGRRTVQVQPACILNVPRLTASLGVNAHSRPHRRLDLLDRGLLRCFPGLRLAKLFYLPGWVVIGGGQVQHDLPKVIPACKHRHFAMATSFGAILLG